MRWPDEHYVKVYTRDNADWLALTWEARSLFLLLLRKVDHAGLLDTGRHGLRAVAMSVNMPFDVVERAMPELLEDGCVQVHGNLLLVPKYVEAQEARKSETQKKRDYRERSRASAVAQGRGITMGAVHPVSPPVPMVSPPVPMVSPLGHPPALPCSALPCSKEVSEQEVAVPVEQVAAGAVAKPKSRKPSRQQKAYSWCVEKREGRTTESDAPLSVADQNAMIREPLDELGGEQFRKTYLNYLEDSYARNSTPPFPMKLFLSQWRRHKPKRGESSQPEALKLVSPDEDIYRS